jgi:hypothetical protein
VFTECPRGDGQRAEEKRSFKLPHSQIVSQFDGSSMANFPAVKIAGFGVQKEYCRGEIGIQRLNMVNTLFLVNNRTGCRFITVDA